jgi:hypothetical protein
MRLGFWANLMCAVSAVSDEFIDALAKENVNPDTILRLVPVDGGVRGVYVLRTDKVVCSAELVNAIDTMLDAGRVISIATLIRSAMVSQETIRKCMKLHLTRMRRRTEISFSGFVELIRLNQDPSHEKLSRRQFSDITRAEKGEVNTTLWYIFGIEPYAGRFLRDIPFLLTKRLVRRYDRNSLIVMLPWEAIREMLLMERQRAQERLEEDDKPMKRARRTDSVTPATLTSVETLDDTIGSISPKSNSLDYSWKDSDFDFQLFEFP